MTFTCGTQVELESTLEMEQEALVNRLQRRLSELLSQQQLQQTLGLSSSSSTSYPGSPMAQDPSSPIPSANFAAYFSNSDPANPSTATLLDALHTENTSLRSQLAEAESTTQQVEKINEMYRRELLQLRAKVGMDVADIAEPAMLGSPRMREAGPRAGVLGASAGRSETGAIRIPGMPQSPPARDRSTSKSSYSPSISSALSMGTPYSASSGTNATTPSTSYTTPQAPASTPVNYTSALAGSRNAFSGASTPYGSVSSTNSNTNATPASTYRVPPPSMASSLGATETNSVADQSGPAVPIAGRMLASSPIQERPESAVSSHSESSESLRTHDNYSHESRQKRLSNSRQGARVAETGVLRQRTSSGGIPTSKTLAE